MSILLCPNCKKLVSDVLSSCPNCGSPVSDIVKNNSNNKLIKFQDDTERRSLLWFVVVLTALIIIAGAAYVNSGTHIGADNRIKNFSTNAF